MALEGHAGIRLAHPLAVVDDLNGRTSRILHQHIDGRCTGIHGILHQFLDDGCRTLHNLAGCDLVGNRIGKKVYDVHPRFFLVLLLLIISPLSS